MQLYRAVIAGVLMSSGMVFAQDEMPGMMGRGRAEMMEWRKKMADEMKAQDAELDRLAAEMNAATGEKKVDAVAAVLNKMIEQRKAWHARMEQMHEKMQGMMPKGGGKPGMSPGMNMPKPGTTP
ncbi:MAG: hypothetical protein WCP06_06090 [Verrucomicrobiota bacterium]